MSRRPDRFAIAPCVLGMASAVVVAAVACENAGPQSADVPALTATATVGASASALTSVTPSSVVLTTTQALTAASVTVSASALATLSAPVSETTATLALPTPTAPVDSATAPAASSAPPHSGLWKIMALGDSTTAATCYRQKLWKKLADAGKTNVDFVGTRKDSSGQCSDVAADFDSDNEGHSCYIVANLVGKVAAKPDSTCKLQQGYDAAPSDLTRWFDDQAPDIVLMHFGTNDAWNGLGPNDILPAYQAILDKLRSRNPNVRFFVAQIIPLKPDANKNYDKIVRDLNAAIPAWAAENSTTASPVTVVDQFTGFDAEADTSDRVHPSATTGSEKIAEKWFEAIQSLL